MPELSKNNKEILVSIICTAYNHEKYIKYAIDGFLMQKTNFRYEILINDDASTDNTPNIIKEYEIKYPDLFKVIYQKENQYSKGISVTKNLLEIARGKYLAFCEGDDYWIDEKKLQKQVNFLEKHQNFSAVVHNALVIDEFNKELKKEQNCCPLYGNYILKRYKGLPDHLLGQLGTMVCINYWHILKNRMGEKFIKIFETRLPTGAGDTKLTLLLNQMGDMYHLEEIMSCYRRTYTGDSYNARVHNLDLSIAYYDSITILDEIMQKIFEQESRVKNVKLAHNILVGSYFIKFLKTKKSNDLKIFFKLYYYHNDKIGFIFQFMQRIFNKFCKLNLLNQYPLNREYFEEFKKNRQGYEF